MIGLMPLSINYNFNKKDSINLIKFAEDIMKDELWFEEFGLLNKNKDVYFLLDFGHSFDDKNEQVPEANIFIATNQKNKEILKLLPNNKGTTYTNLIFGKFI